MKIQSFSHPASLRSLPSRPAPAQEKPSQVSDQVDLSSSQSAAQETPSKFGSRAVGALAGALVGIMAGHAGPAGVALAAGVGATAVAVAAAGPFFKDSLDQSMTGNPIHDVLLTCGTVAAAGILTAQVAGAAGGLGYGLSHLMPSATPVLGGLVGASVGGYFGMKN